ncbi:MAG: RluA family pseudouridine synthase [Firmicutes bacterium]|nr:RluA family pseudouridine synthase [Bacillota bacterium]
MTDKNIEFQIREDSQGQRLDVFLAEEYAEFTRSRIQNMIRDGLVTVNGAKVKTGYKLQAGDQLQMLLVDDAPAHSVAEDIELDVVYEDADIIVVNKPQGMVVHPAFGHPQGTLVNALLHHCGDLAGINGVVRPGIVHRIDMDTSGLLVVAKNDAAYLGLTAQWRTHDIERRYHALLHGIIPEDRGTIDAPIGRHPRERKKMAVEPKNGRDAITHYRVLERLPFAGCTYTEMTLETGRTHQIRVHMAHLGHPVVGDKTYGRRKEKYELVGQTLHAKVLGFKHPISGEELRFESPLPEYFQRLLEEMRLPNV